MSTKVKGEAIKEGSIPLSALGDEVKESINNSVGFKEFNGYLSIDTPLEIQAYDGRDYYYVKTSDDVIKLNTTNGDETHIPVGPPFSIKYDITEYPKAKLSIITDHPDHHIDLKIPVFRGINTNEAFIPNTVLKTTTQELSETDKNQALANLGIDSVVWKYMCNPYVYVVRGEENLPNDLISIIEDENGHLNSLTFNVLSFQYVTEDDETMISRIKSIHIELNAIRLLDDTFLRYEDGKFI